MLMQLIRSLCLQYSTFIPVQCSRFKNSLYEFDYSEAPTRMSKDRGGLLMKRVPCAALCAIQDEPVKELREDVKLQGTHFRTNRLLLLS